MNDTINNQNQNMNIDDVYKQGQVKTPEKLGFLGFSTATNIAYNFKSLYYLYFLTNVLLIEVEWAGIMVVLGTIWDALNDPLIALFCANRKFKNGEKIRPYALWCSLPWAITIVLLFVNFHQGQTVSIIIGLIVYFIFEALYTFLCMPYNSMASLATKNDADRKSINAYRSLGGCLGSGIGAVAIPMLVKLFGGLKDHTVIDERDSRALLITALLMGVICIAGSLFHYFTAKERVKPDEDDKEDKINLIQAYKMLFKCKSWRNNMFYILGYGITTALVMQNVNYYAAYILGDSTMATPILAFYLVIAIIASIITPILDKKMGRRNLMLLAIAVIVLGKIPFIIKPTSLINVCINAATVGFGETVTFVIFNTNRNNIADILEVQNNRRIDTLVAGGDNLISKLAEAAAIEGMTLIFGITGMNSKLEVQTEATLNWIGYFLGWVPAIISLCMIYFILRIDIPKELEESKKNNPKYNIEKRIEE